MKKQLNEVQKLQKIAGLLKENQLNEKKEPDFVIPANDSYDLDEEADFMCSILKKNKIDAKCEAGFGEVEVYLFDKSQLKNARRAIEGEGYQTEKDSNW